MKLSSLYLQSFRGATKPVTLYFNPEKSITLIYAENGNGKSSIADSLVCICTSELGTLGDKSGTDHSFLKSVGAKSSDLLIKLTTDKEEYQATMSPTSNKLLKSPPSGQPKLRALRRKHITSFIDNTPGDRYKTLSAFIDVTNIQKSEAELRKLVSSLEKDLNANVVSVTEANDTLSDFWKKEGMPSGTRDAWVKLEISRDLSTARSEIANNVKTLTSWASLKTIKENIQSEREKLDAATSTKQKAELALQTYKIENANADSDTLNVLLETDKFLKSKEDLTKCPVCEQDNTKAALVSSIQKRIESMKELNLLTDDLTKANKEVQAQTARLQSQVDPFNKHLTQFKESSSLINGSDISSLLVNISIEKSTKHNHQEFVAVFEKLSICIDSLKTANDSLNTSVAQYNAIKSSNDTIERLTAKASDINDLLSKARLALEYTEAERKNYIDSELASIASDVEQMYQEIHPQESLGGVKLFLDKKSQGSLHFTANFHSTEGVTPQSVYSESHLDTLGICIFMALAKKESEKDLILVLDDVIMSVDEQHLDRVIKLIHSQAKYFVHVFISTHYRPWRERYRNHRAENSDIHFVELRNWSLEKGITIAKPQLILDEIKEFLVSPEKFHRENLSSVTGRFLEAILDFLTYNFQCKLKRRPAGDYTLSELLDAPSHKLLALLKIHKMKLLDDGKYSSSEIDSEIPLRPIIDKIKQLKTVRNQVGAHYTFDGAYVSDNDIIDFANCTVELAEALICPKNGNLPDRKPSGSFWETKSGSLRLFPLVEP